MILMIELLVLAALFIAGGYFGEWVARALLRALARAGAWREERQERLNQRKGEKHGF